MHISYRINHQDEIIFFNEGWVQFANDTSNQNLNNGKILYQSIWRFISGETAKNLYRHILRKVREGYVLKLNLRCDSPQVNQLFELTIALKENNEVQFDSRLLWTEDRLPSFIHHTENIKTAQILIVCSWCDKINVGMENWQEIDDAIKTLDLFELDNLPLLSHGMCSNCYQLTSQTFRNSFVAG